MLLVLLCIIRQHVVLFFDQNVMTFSISETAYFPADVLNPSYFSGPILVRNAHFSQSNQVSFYSISHSIFYWMASAFNIALQCFSSKILFGLKISDYQSNKSQFVFVYFPFLKWMKVKAFYILYKRYAILMYYDSSQKRCQN